MTETVLINFVERGARIVDRRIRGIGTASAASATKVNLLKRSLLFIGGAGILLAMAQLGRGFVNIGNQAIVLENKIRVVTPELEKVGEIMNNIFDISARTRAPVNELATVFSRASLAAGELSASQEELLRFTENVGLALAIQGGTAQSARGALIQLSQAIGQDIVRAEEFNAILEGTLPIAQAAARNIDAAGGSVARLRRLVIEGDVTSKQFFKAIIADTENLEEAFGRSEPTITQAFFSLNNNLVRASILFEKDTGLVKGLARGMIDLANAIPEATDAFIQFFNVERDLDGTTITFSRTIRGMGVELRDTLVQLDEFVAKLQRLQRQQAGTGNDVSSLLNTILNVTAGAIKALVVAFEELPNILDVLLIDITNGLLRIVETFTNKTIDAVNRMANALKPFPDIFKSNLLDPIEITLLKTTGNIDDSVKRIKEAFDSLQGENLFADIIIAWDTMGFSAEKAAETVAKSVDKIKPKIVEMSETAKQLEKDLKNLVTSGVDRLGGSIADLALEGKNTFREFALSIARDIIKITTRALILQPLLQALGLGGAVTSAAAVQVPGVGALPSAKGNAFTGNGVQQFASGGIIDQMTSFLFTQGGKTRVGTAGEAGPEAILPLTRTSGGQLGVSTVGQAPVIQVNVSVVGGDGDAEVTQQQNQSGGLDIAVILDSATAGNLNTRGSATRSAMKNNFPVQDQLVSR